MPPYAEKYPVGTEVEIAPRAALETFQATWRLHNRLHAEQLQWAGAHAVILEVGFYHGGDPLYTLRGVPGVWHEACLVGVGERAP